MVGAFDQRRIDFGARLFDRFAVFQRDDAREFLARFLQQSQKLGDVLLTLGDGRALPGTEGDCPRRRWLREHHRESTTETKAMLLPRKAGFSFSNVAPFREAFHFAIDEVFESLDLFFLSNRH